MEPASTLSNLPFRKVPRKGQMHAFKACLEPGRRTLNVKLPTGYGKTFVNVGCYSLLKRTGRVNRLLVVFPTTAQIKQFVADGPRDLMDAGVDGPLAVHDIGYFKTNALVEHCNNKGQVFAITSQALIGKNGREAVCGLLKTGRWMLTVDEYHHYGIDKAWGDAIKAVRNMNCEFILAMSATPYRPGNDSLLGKPDISVLYREAVEELAVKPLWGHSYVYRIDAVMEDGSIRTFTTDDLVNEVGSDSPDAIEQHRIKKRMRWSPKYVSPLVTHPIERMLRDRLDMCGTKLQAIVGTLCVSHASLVCDQIRALYPELEVDWVGTGPNGKSDEDNAKVIKRFCPEKDHNGIRTPTLDVLVHVGMAGEGLDCVNVSEVIHLNAASMNNTNNQENGRASRYLPGVIGNINFDSSSDYARKTEMAPEGYIGKAIMDAMDNLPAQPDRKPSPDEEQEQMQQRDLFDMRPLPEEPGIQILNMELENIRSDDPEVLLYRRVAIEKGFVSHEHFADPDSPYHQAMVEGYRNMRNLECQQHNKEAILTQWHEAVNNALSAVTGLVVRKMTASGQRVEKTMIGDIKRRINSRKKATLGEISRDEQVYRNHYRWIVQLQKELTGGIPSWLV